MSSDATRSDPMSSDQGISGGMEPPVAPDSRRRHLLTSLGAITAAVLASLCCVGPLLFVTLGVGAGLASQFEPLRPLFTAVTLVLLAIGFYTVYGRTPATSATPAAARAPSMTGDQCALPARRGRRDRMVFWAAALLALLVLTFPQWSLLFV